LVSSSITQSCDRTTIVAAVIAGPVLVVGAGLLGTSVGLALQARGVEVWLRDQEASAVRTASGLGAGVSEPSDDGHPVLVVVAVPPHGLGSVVREALRRYPETLVTDVGSVKAAPLSHLVPGIERYCGSHPMAGSERSGALAASGSLFEGRPWAITPHESTVDDAVAMVESLVSLCGGVPMRMTPSEHDLAVARVSHLPHLMSALVAGLLRHAPATQLALAGQGVRDVTRIAASDPRMWEQIVTLNSEAVLGLLTEIRADLDVLISGIADDDLTEVRAFLDRGVAGSRAVPGKHGGPAPETSSLFVSVPDHPGELARLFADAGATEVNIEDVYIDHDQGRPTGLVELVITRSRSEQLASALAARGWLLHR
jgi:prephenate dehydrogenase